MSKSLSIDYPIFNYKNESLILKSGQRFSMNELKSRLHQMDVDDVININSKSQMENLYDSIIKDDRNKIKILDRLRKDTLNYSKMTGINFNQRRRLPEEDAYTQESNEKSKLINLQTRRYNEPYEQNNNNTNNNYNYRKQEIKLRKNNKNIRNPFREEINNNINDNNLKEQNEDTYYQEYNNNKNNNNNIEYSRKFQNEESGYSDINNTNNYNNNYNYRNNNNMNNNRYGYNNNNEKIYTNSPENYTPYQEPENQINNKNHLVQNIIPNTENIENTKSDVESNFSFFSGFSTFKNKKQICFHILTGFIVICLALGLLYLYREFSESINGFFSNIYSTIIHPGEIINSVFSLLRNYWYLIPIILICLIIIISILKRYKLRKRCEEIFRKILDDLRTDDENRSISEEDIYRKYVQGYGISWKKFEKNYLPILRKMRGKNHKLKEFSENIEGKPVKFWEYYP